MIERVCVVGAGAIGSLYAGHLAGVASVAVLTRRKEQAHALATEGLRISGKQDFTALVEASDDPAELADADLVIVATKATQLEEAAAQLAGRSPGAVVMTVQNGLGAEEVVRRHGDWPLISAVTFMSGVRRSDTHVEYELDTPTWMGPYAGTQTRLELVEEVHKLLVDSGLHGRGVRRISCRPSGRSSSSTPASTRSPPSPVFRTSRCSRARRSRPISAISSTASSTKASAWPPPPASASTRIPGR